MDLHPHRQCRCDHSDLPHLRNGPDGLQRELRRPTGNARITGSGQLHDHVAFERRVSVSSSGAVTVTGNPAAGSYTVSGTDTDGFGDLGIWSYTLVLTASTISQNAPKSNSVAPISSAKFTEKLSTSGGVAPVSFVTVATTKPSGATGGLKVSSSGEVSTTGLLTAGTYSASGTDSDALGDAGKWSLHLDGHQVGNHPGGAVLEHTRLSPSPPARASPTS